MQAELVTQIACVHVDVDDCLKASLCLLASRKYICMSVQAWTTCFSQTAEQVNCSRLFSHGPGHRVRREDDMHSSAKLGLSSMPPKQSLKGEWYVLQKLDLVSQIDILVLCLHLRLNHL